jgi:hypothetical protein
MPARKFLPCAFAIFKRRGAVDWNLVPEHTLGKDSSALFFFSGSLYGRNFHSTCGCSIRVCSVAGKKLPRPTSVIWLARKFLPCALGIFKRRGAVDWNLVPERTFGKDSSALFFFSGSLYGRNYHSTCGCSIQVCSAVGKKLPRPASAEVSSVRTGNF